VDGGFCQTAEYHFLYKGFRTGRGGIRRVWTFLAEKIARSLDFLGSRRVRLSRQRSDGHPEPPHPCHDLPVGESIAPNSAPIALPDLADIAILMISRWWVDLDVRARIVTMECLWMRTPPRFFGRGLFFRSENLIPAPRARFSTCHRVCLPATSLFRPVPVWMGRATPSLAIFGLPWDDRALSPFETRRYR